MTKKVPANFTERLTAVEQQLEFLNGQMRLLDQVLGNYNERFIAITSILGTDAVKDALAGVKYVRDKSRFDENTKAMEDGFAKGFLRDTETVTDVSGVSGTQILGEDTDPTKFFSQFNEFVFSPMLTEGLGQALLGARVGDVREFRGAKLRVDRIYEVDHTKAAVMTEVTQAESQPAT